MEKKVDTLQLVAEMIQNLGQKDAARAATMAMSLHQHTVLLNLDDAPPPFFTRFTRLLEVVSTEEDDRAKARERFGFYRDRGYAINNYDLSKKS